MNRFRDYLDFSVQFFGLGYVALWPVSTPDGDGVFGAGVVCGGLFDRLCRMPHPLHFGLGLHAVGALCALLAVMNLALAAMRRLRRRGAAAAESAVQPIPPTAIAIAPAPKRARRPLPPPRRLAQPRQQFGLRGLPR